MSATPPAARRLIRLARLLVGSNELRRTSDRFEGAVITTLLAAFIAAVTMVSVVSVRIYQSERAAVGSLRPAVAVLADKGPTEMMYGAGEAQASWRAPGSRERSGLLSAAIAPGIENARRGSRIRIWITNAGYPAAPPQSEAAMLLSATGFALWMLVGVAGFLMFCYWLCRLLLDRRRLAVWESSWARVGPRWTTRR